MKARRPASRYHVYVVELDDRVWNQRRFRDANPGCDVGKPFLYVGMTGLDPDLRFDRHKAGIQANRYVQDYGLRLRAGALRRLQPDAVRGGARDGGRAGDRPARGRPRGLAGLSG